MGLTRNISLMTDATTIETSTLGNTVALGELYNANTGAFYGVQLYTQDSIKKAHIETPRDPPFSEFQLSVTNGFQDKAQLLDVKAQLSLEILAGTVSVSGSASYLKDEKSTTNQQAWIMSLKQLGKEERIVCGSSDLVKISDNLKNYPKATHYVSAVRYGGNVFLRMLELSTKLSSSEKIAGHLQAELTGLKGAIKLEGTINLKLEDDWSSLDNKFDLQMYGDFTPKHIPVNAKQVIELFPDAITEIKKAGVPVSVVLQPVPDSKTGVIHAISEKIVNSLLDAYAGVEDLSNRFLLLLEDVNQWINIIPDLQDVVDTQRTDFMTERGTLRTKLKSYLTKVASGETADSTEILKDANALLKKNALQTDDDKNISQKPPAYPTSLAGLERAYTRFNRLATAVSSHTALHLKKIDDISQNLQHDTDSMLFISWSTSISDVSVFATLIRSGHTVYGFTKPCYALFIEDIADIDDDTIPSGKDLNGKLTSSNACGLFHYTKKDPTITWTEISWKDVQAATTATTFKEELNYATHHIRQSTATMTTGMALNEFRPNKSFTAVAKVIFDHKNAASDTNYVFLTIGSPQQVQHTPQFVLAIQGERVPHMLVYMPGEQDKTGKYKSGKEPKYTSLGEKDYSKLIWQLYELRVAFVQDTSKMTWTAYIQHTGFNTKFSQQIAIPNDYTWQDIDYPLQMIGFQAPDTTLIKCENWRGTMTSLRCYPSALTESEVGEC